jgi:hypothetical protein
MSSTCENQGIRIFHFGQRFIGLGILSMCDLQRFDVADLGNAGDFFVAVGDEVNVFGNIAAGIPDIQIKLGGIFVEQV